MPMDLAGGQKTIGSYVVDEPAGLLFDCDGTLIDTMPLFFFSWLDVCPKFGMQMSEDAFYSFAGMPLPDIVKALHRDQLGGEATAAFVDDFLKEKKRLHAANEAARGHPKRIDCVAAIARGALSRGVPVALATSGLRDHVEDHLKHAGLDDIFNATLGNIVTAADVAHGKPAPDIFIEAARRLGVDPRCCRAYEDGESGLISAHRAGCHVIDVTYMHEYPSCAGLRKAKDEAARDRTWLPEEGAGVLRSRGAYALYALLAATTVGLVALKLASRTRP